MAQALLSGLQFFPGAEAVGGNTLTQSGRGSVTFGQKPFLNAHANAAPSGSFDARGLSRNRYQAHAVSAQTLDLEARPQTKGQRFHVPDFLPVRGLRFLSLVDVLVSVCGGVTWTCFSCCGRIPLFLACSECYWGARTEHDCIWPLPDFSSLQRMFCFCWLRYGVNLLRMSLKILCRSGGGFLWTSRRQPASSPVPPAGPKCQCRPAHCPEGELSLDSRWLTVP